MNAFIERYLEPASDAHYATLMSPEATRAATAAAFAYFFAMRGLLAIQPDVAPTKITWWHDALSALREGRAVHPVLEPLLPFASDDLVDQLNALLHGAVMDYNQVEVDADNLDDYLRLRAGALHVILGQLEKRTVTADVVIALGRIHGLGDILREAREPEFAEQPAAAICLDGDLATTLSSLREAAAAELSDAQPGGVASTVLLKLQQAHWPLIVKTPFGERTPTLPPWRKLWLSWRAARSAARPPQP